MIFYKIQIDYVSRTKVQEKADEGRATMTKDRARLGRVRISSPRYVSFFVFIY